MHLSLLKIIRQYTLYDIYITSYGLDTLLDDVYTDMGQLQAFKQCWRTKLKEIVKSQYDPISKNALKLTNNIDIFQF